MKTMLKVITAIIIVSVFLSGCTSETGQPKQDGNVEIVKIRYAHNQDTLSVLHKSIEKFKDKVEELSEGRIQVTIYPNQQAGAMREQIEQVQDGTLEMTQQPTSVFSNFDQRFEVFELPFLFANLDAMKEVVTGPFGQKLLGGLDDIGMVGLGYETAGMKNITGNNPIRLPADLHGKKYRVMPAPILVKLYESWGVNPVPIDYAEVYNALQQGVIDGFENSMPGISAMKIYEVQDHLAMTKHGPMLFVTAANKEWFEALPEDLRQNVIEAMEYMDETEFEDQAKQNEIYLQEVADNGMEVYHNTEEERMAFREAAQEVEDFIAERIGSDLVNEAIEAATAANEKYKGASSF